MPPNTRIRLGALLAAMALSPGIVMGDDSDIYVGRILPPSSEPLVMFSVDNSPSLWGTYGGCTKVGSGSSLCPPASFFKDNCAGCKLPAADQPLTYYDAIRFSLRMVLLETTGIKIGLMLNHDHNQDCAGPQTVTDTSGRCSNGGYIARGLRSVDRVVIPGLLGQPSLIAPGPNLDAFLSVLDQMPQVRGQTHHPYQGKELFFELFRYLTGQGIYNAHNGYTDYGTDTQQNLNEDNPVASWDTTIENPLTRSYISPLTTELTCSRIFTVNFLLDQVRQDNDSDATITSASPGGLTGINLSGANNDFSTVVGYLYDVDLAREANPFGALPALDGKQNVTSYFFVPPTPRHSDPPSFDRKNMRYAQLGGTTRPLPLSENPAELVEHLRGVLSQVASVSTTFVSAAVPVNAFNRTQVLDEAYLALFQPDAAAKPFWPGNVKKLKLSVVDVPCPAGTTGCVPAKDVRLVDALGEDAVALDGRIKFDALTFWTDGSRIAGDAAKGVIAGRDGRHVDRGGAGQKIPGLLSGKPGTGNSEAGARQLYLYPGTGDSMVALNADSATTGLVDSILGTGSTRVLQALRYLRGFDAYDEDGDLDTSEVRPWLMGDPMHSRPLPINYGAYGGHTEDNPAIFIAAGTNQGLLHFIRNTGAGGADNGGEVWAFMPVELLRIVEKLGLNNPLGQRIYGFDGAPTARIVDRNGNGTIEPEDGDRVYLYAGMRRGGRAYYALDVTDPLRPRFLWKIDPAVSGFAELGHTFSQPQVGRVFAGHDDEGNRVTRAALFFGGGYDLNKDYPGLIKELFEALEPSDGSVGTNDSMGNAIFVVDAETGELIWKAVHGGSTGPTGDPRVFSHAALTDSIPSTLTIVDTTGDGLVDRIAVGDTGGNIWRADLGGDLDGETNAELTQVTDDWRLTLVARFGRHAGSGKVNDRRFFHEPDYVQSQDERGPFDAIVIGSGDREDPLDYGRQRTDSLLDVRTGNRIFVIKDRRTGVYAASDTESGSILTPQTLADVTDNCLQQGFSAECNPDLRHGWFIRLVQAPGEKSLSSPLTAAGRVFLTTYLPTDQAETLTCGPAEGSGLFYAVSLKTGTAVLNFNLADGGTATGGPNTAADRFQALSSYGIPSEPVYLNLVDPADGEEARCLLGSDLECRPAIGATRFRTYWYRDE